MSDDIFSELLTFLKMPSVLALVLTEMAVLRKPGNNLKTTFLAEKHHFLVSKPLSKPHWW